METDTGESGISKLNGGGPIPGTSPEHHSQSGSFSRHGSRSSLSGGSGNGSKSSSLERRGRIASDGAVSGLEDSGRSSMTSPLNLPMEHLQSFNATYGGGQRTYLESLSIPRQLTSQISSKNPVISPTHHARSHIGHGHHGRASSASSLSTTALRDRSLDRLERDHIYSGDRSLDRHLDRMQLSIAMDSQRDRSAKTYSRDRSLDREYPHMGARSLERDHSSVARSRSSDRGGDYPVSSYLTSSPSPQDYRNNFIFELQVQVTELHQECAKLQKEVEITRDKLSSSMNSIKTFWSPELKKERSMRKEETAKCNMFNEQLKVTQAELKRHRELIHELQSKMGTGEGVEIIAAATVAELETVKREKDSQCKELHILRRTVDELEIRIETQKQTLAARDASIKTLLDMLQGKGMAVGQLDVERQELESLRAQTIIDGSKIRQLEAAVDLKEAEILKLAKESEYLRENMSTSLDIPQSAISSHTITAMLEAKDLQIAGLQHEVQTLEEKLLKSKEDLSLDDRHDSASKDSSIGRDKQLRAEIQNLREKLGQRERELASLRLQEETVHRQHQETLHHVTVLKEQLSAKDKQIAMLQADIEGFQERLKNKDGTIERKNKESQAVAAEKRRLEAEVVELKEQLDTKECKITILQTKVESQEDLVREKEEQLVQVKSRLTFTDSTDSAISSLEESITEKDRQIERLREMREQADRDHQEELNVYVKTTQDLKTQMEAMHVELTAKQTELCELREEAAELRAENFRANNKMRQLEAAAKEYHSKMFQEAKTMLTAEVQTEATREVPVSTEQHSSLPADTVVAGEGVNAEAVVDSIESLQKKLREMEEDKKEKEAQIAEMQDVIKEYRQKVGTLKRNQQTEKKKNAQLLEEARKREDTFTDDASQLSIQIKQKNERIEELEEALRESVRITAQREMDMAELQAQIDASKTAMEEMRKEVEAMQASSRDYSSKLATLTRQLEDRDNKLRRMSAERQKHLEEVYEMKQEAVQAAISEKDATIALLEMTSTKKQRNLEEIERLTHEKHSLQSNLREVTQNLMKLRESAKDKGGNSSSSSSSSSKGKKTVAQRLRNAPPEQVDHYILTAHDPSLMDS